LEKRTTTIDDLARLATPGDPQISPDGSRIAYVLKTTDLEKNRYFTHIWVVPAARDGGVPQQWTRSGVGGEERPRWSPDGSYLAFTSGREEKKAQLYLLPTNGGEAEKVTNLPSGNLGDVSWSPDGTRIAFTFRPIDEEWTEEAGEERKKAKKSSPPRMITRRHWREEGAGYTPRSPYRLQVFDLATRELTTFEPEGDRDAGSFCWSPDGTKLAVVRNTSDAPDLFPNATELFVYDAASPDTAPTKLEAPLGPKHSLSWSPDGKYIAYLGHSKSEEMWGVTNHHPWIAALDGSGARDLTPNWDITCGSTAIGDIAGSGASGPFWAADSHSLLFLASDRGAVNVYRVSLDTDATPVRLTEGTHAVLGFTPDARTETLALLVGTPTDAGDIYTLSVGSAVFHRRTRINQTLLDEMDMPAPIYFEAPTAEGHTVPCWAVLPPDYADNPRPRPTIVYTHGGPHLMYAHVLFHEYQALASAGYVVLYPNPRGSKGYGEAWTGAIVGNWGPPAHDDALACLDYALAQGWTDAARVGAAGGSYGGFLTAWMVGHTDRFAAAVAERGVFNLHSMAGTCDFVWRDGYYFGANTTDDPAGYLRNSPLTYAEEIKCPLLIVHSEGDLRCPIEQAEQLFAALLLRRREVAFLRYGAESNHNLSRGGPPDLRLDRQHQITAWFDKYLKPAPEA
jgi:dipeptidyl aminopeptidase/acylaminoacyl peptidase